MPVIDDFVLQIGFDAKNMASGQRQVEAGLKKTKADAKATGDDIEKQATRAAEFAGKLRNQIIALYAVFTAGRGLKEFVTDITAADSALGRLAFRIDTNAGTLAAWRGAGAMVGATAQDVYGTFQNLTNQFEQFAVTGNASTIPFLRAMGIQLKHTKDGALDTNAELLDMAQWAGAQKDKARAAYMLQNAGVSEGMANLILLGPDAIKEFLALQAKYKPLPQDIKAAADMQKAFVTLDFASSRLGRTLQTELTPFIVGLTQKLVAIADWFNANPDALNIVAGGLALIGGALSLKLAVGSLVAIGRLGTVLKLLTGVGVAAEGAADATAGLGLAMGALPFAVVVAGIGAVILAGIELINHWKEIKQWAKDLWGDNAGGPSNKPGHKLAWQGLGEILAPWAPWVVPLIQYGQDLYGGGTSSDIPLAAQKLLGRISAGESGGAYNVMYGGSKFSSYSDHPNQGHLITSGPNAGQMSTAAGRYQFTYSTWKRAQAALGLKDFSPASQDKAAWWLAQQDYQSRTGRNLLSDLNSGDPGILAGIGQALSSTWTSLSAGSLAGFGAGTAAISHNSSSHSSSKTVHVGQVIVNTQAKDANGIARDIVGALERGAFAVQADYGAA